MGRQQEDSAAGVVIAVVAAVLIIGFLLLAGLIGLGVVFYLFRSEQPTPVEVRAEPWTTEGEPRLSAQPSMRPAVPSTGPSPTEPLSMGPPCEVLVTFDSDGKIFLDGEPVAFDLLEDRLAARRDARPRTYVRLRADENCAIKHVLRVMDLCGSLDLGVSIRTTSAP